MHRKANHCGDERHIGRHWLDIEYEGYQDGPRPKAWEFQQSALSGQKVLREIYVSL